MRVPQPKGERGSLKWIQRAVAHRADLIQPAGHSAIEWLSPRADDDFAEYRDGDFLRLLSLDTLNTALSEFWPTQGPQWDALGRSEDQVYLVEAKAHVAEFLTSPCMAGAASRQKIKNSLDAVKSALGADPSRDWLSAFYQYANRLAHLWWLRDRGVAAHLLCVDFLGDAEQNGPQSSETWQATYLAADYAMGLRRKHALSRYIHHLHPSVSDLALEA